MNPHRPVMLERFKQRHHLPDPRLHIPYRAEKLGNLLPAVAELAAEREDHAGEVLDVGG